MAGYDEMLSALAGGAAIPGVMGVGPGRTWDAVVSTHAGELTGDAVTFVALGDGTLIVYEDVPDGSLGPIADALEEMVAPPYRGAAARNEGDVWTAVAESVSIAELPDVLGDTVDLSLVGGVRELTVDGEPATTLVPALDRLVEDKGDVAVHAERLDRDLFAVDVFPL
jgi:hypothetical protein